MASSNKVSLDSIGGFYDKGAYFENNPLKPKTRVEMRMIKASAFIRSTPEWAEQLSDEGKRQEWGTQVKDTFKLIDKEVEYVFEELEYYALLKDNAVAGEELAGIDNVWIIDSASDSDIAKEIKLNTAMLESNLAQTRSNDVNSAPSVDSQVLVDPFLYPFVAKDSQVLTKPIESPEDSLDLELPRIHPGTLESWMQTIDDFNKRASSSEDICGERKILPLINWDGVPVRSDIWPPPRGDAKTPALDDVYKCWLPTDFDVSEDGSVVVRSYINNLHPTRYANLYQTISRVFAKFVPLLAQVATDVIHPRGLRAVFSLRKCCVPRMLESGQVTSLLFKGESLPTEFYRFVTTSPAYHPNGYGNSTTMARGVIFDADAYEEAWEDALDYTEPEPEPFCPPGRPLAPLDMRGLPLQASVEMFNISLTPENPKSLEGVWKSIGRAEERIFAVGLYFYDMENVASAKLMFRDQLEKSGYNHPDTLLHYRLAHDVNSIDRYKLYYIQEVGSVEIADGKYICYPNCYQTKMPSFELMDPTKPGHIKCIAFYIVDPATRLLSTRVIPPQQPSWALSDEQSSDVADEDAIIKRDDLKTMHASYIQSANDRFDHCAKDQG